MALPAFIFPHMYSSEFTPFWATQVESRLPAARHRRSLLQTPKSISGKLKSPDLQPLNVSPTATGPSSPQKTSVLHSKHLLIGQRVWTADGRVGTLQFKGKTHFSQGCLCGIQLDDPLGKNDGSVDGIHYFKCSPNHGIFIHAFKVQAVNSAGEVKPLELAPNTSGKIVPPSQQGTGKETKPSSKIPALGGSGKITRPKSLLVNEEKTFKPPAGRKSIAKRAEISRVDCFSAEKASNSSKLFQKKRISPADSGITVPGWTHDKTPPSSRLPSIHSKSPSACSRDATFTYAHDQSATSKKQVTDRSPPSRKRTPDQPSPRAWKPCSGNLKKGLSSRPSLNDLTQLLQDNSKPEGDKSRLRKESGLRPKTNFNETFEVEHVLHGTSPILAEKTYRKDSPASTTKDLNRTYDKKESPLLWDPVDKITSTPTSSDNSYFWESDGISQSDVKDTFDAADVEEEDVEYNEFWAVPSTLDTPTGKLRFDLLTPEEFEQALKDCNIPLESPQNPFPPPFEEPDTEPLLTDHCKPKVLASLTVVEDDLLIGSDSTLENIPSFLVPAWSMEADAENLETSLSERKDSALEPTLEADEQVESPDENKPAAGIWSAENSDVTNNNAERLIDRGVNQPESEIAQAGGDRTKNTGAMSESDARNTSLESTGTPPSSAVGSSLPDAAGETFPLDSTLTREDDQCTLTDDDWKNLLQQAEADLDAAVHMASDSQIINGGISLSSHGSTTDEPKVEPLNNTDMPLPNVSCQSTSHHQTTTFTVRVDGGKESQVSQSAVSGKACVEHRTGGAKAVSPTVTLNILSATFDNTTSPEKERSFASEGSSESASTVIAEAASENDQDQNQQQGIKERSPSAELETVTQCEMAEMTSPSFDKKKFGPEAFNSQPVGKSTQNESLKGRENGDHSKLPRKRMSYLQQPKSFSSSRESEVPTKSHVAAAKLKLTAVKSLDSKTDPSGQESKVKKGHISAAWKLNGKNAPAASKGPNGSSNTNPNPKTADGKDAKPAGSKLVGVKSKIDTGRKSVDLTGNKPSLSNKKSSGQNSTSSLEVEPSSLSSSNRSMKSDLSGVGTRTSSRSNSIGGKPANKTTKSLRHTDRTHQERKTSTSTVNSETSQRTESRASLSSRHSTSTSDAKHHVKRPRPTPRKELPSNGTPRTQAFSFSKPSRPAPVSLAKSKSNPAKHTDCNQSKNDSLLTNSLTNGVTTIDAAPVRRGGPSTRLPRTSLLPSKKPDNAQRQDAARRFSVGKEADGPKPAKGRSSPSPAPSADAEHLAKAKTDIKRLEALCESRTKELNMMRLNLRAGLQGFDAMTILVQYLTHKLNAFETPNLQTRIHELERQLEDAKSLTVQKEEELGCIQRELVDTKRCNEEQVTQLQQEHLDQLNHQEERLNAQNTEHIQTVVNEQKYAINTMKEEHVAQIAELTCSHHQAVQEMEEHHIEEVSKIQLQHQEHVEEMNRQLDKDKKQLIDEAQAKQQELHDEVYKWTFQCENHKERVMRLEEALQKDSNAKVQAAILEKRKLEADVESMKSVEELRTNQLMELRRENMGIKKDLEKLPIKDDEILRLKAKVEDLQAMMAKKHDYQQQLSSDHITLRENYEREVNEKKRLSMEKEQLSWRLSLHSEGSSPVSLSPGHTFFPCTSPSRSPTRSPNPSPSVVKQSLSRSSSIESHESGVFSPQTG